MTNLWRKSLVCVFACAMGYGVLNVMLAAGPGPSEGVESSVGLELSAVPRPPCEREEVTFTATCTCTDAEIVLTVQGGYPSPVEKRGFGKVSITVKAVEAGTTVFGLAKAGTEEKSLVLHVQAWMADGEPFAVMETLGVVSPEYVF